MREVAKSPSLASGPFHWPLPVPYISCKARKLHFMEACTSSRSGSRAMQSISHKWHIVAQCMSRITNRPPTKARMLCQDGGKGLPSPSDISNDGGRTASGALSCGQVPQDTSHWKRQLRLGVKLPKEQPTRQKGYGYQKHLDYLRLGMSWPCCINVYDMGVSENGAISPSHGHHMMATWCSHRAESWRRPWLSCLLSLTKHLEANGRQLHWFTMSTANVAKGKPLKMSIDGGLMETWSIDGL